MNTTRQLERLITRMLFDPELVAQLYTSPAELIARGELTEEGLSWILSVDQRRWRADLERSHRALEGLLLHVPLTVALTSLGGTNARRYLDFFQSPALHQAIQGRGLLAEAFGAWLLQHTSCPWPSARAAFNAIELSVSQLKSDEVSPPLQPDEPTSVQLSPKVRLIRSQRGVLERYTELTALLSAAGPLSSLEPQACLSTSKATLDALERGADTEAVTLLTQLVGVQVSISELPSALATLLSASERGLLLSDATAHLASYELDAEAAWQLLVELCDEGLLCLS